MTVAAFVLSIVALAVSALALAVRVRRARRFRLSVDLKSQDSIEHP